MKSKISELDLEYDCGLLTSNEIHIPVLRQAVEIWINSEVDNSGKCSQKQMSVFDNFLNIPPNELEKIEAELQNYGNELVTTNEITKQSLSLPNAYDLTYRSLIIPQQEITKHQYLLILADTQWKIPDTDFVIEIEILIKNNQLDLLQEYSGLWTRPEWNGFYNQ